MYLVKLNDIYYLIFNRLNIWPRNTWAAQQVSIAAWAIGQRLLAHAVAETFATIQLWAFIFLAGGSGSSLQVWNSTSKLQCFHWVACRNWTGSPRTTLGFQTEWYSSELKHVETINDDVVIMWIWGLALTHGDVTAGSIKLASQECPLELIDEAIHVTATWCRNPAVVADLLKRCPKIIR